MPELPEVETTRRGLDAHLRGQTVRAVEVRDRRLRWPVDEAMARELPGQRIVSVDRLARPSSPPSLPPILAPASGQYVREPLFVLIWHC